MGTKPKPHLWEHFGLRPGISEGKGTKVISAAPLLGQPWGFWWGFFFLCFKWERNEKARIYRADLHENRELERRVRSGKFVVL